MVSESSCKGLSGKAPPVANLFGDVESRLVYEWNDSDDKTMIGEDRWLDVNVCHLTIVSGNHDIEPSA